MRMRLRQGCSSRIEARMRGHPRKVTCPGFHIFLLLHVINEAVLRTLRGDASSESLRLGQQGHRHI